MGIDTDGVVDEMDRRIDHYRDSRGNKVDEDIYEPIFGCDADGNVVYFDEYGLRAHESCPDQIADMATGLNNVPCVPGWDASYLSEQRPFRRNMA
ncbi:hypothetical protein CL614_03280 [archaeon]|nr:hypothetical protein [archaeon]